MAMPWLNHRMKNFLVIPVLSIFGIVAAIGAWRVATGRGLWSEAKEPATSAAVHAQANQLDTKQPEVKPAGERASNSTPQAETPIPEIPPEALIAAQTDANIVALISDYIIKKDELEEELIRELQPYDYDPPSADSLKSEPADANEVLTRMAAEKAMIMEGRKNGVLGTEMIFNTVKQFRERQLVNHLMQGQVAGRLTVSEAEIAEKMKVRLGTAGAADPKLDRDKAESAVKRAKANTIMSTYYDELYKKSDVKKATANFTKAAEIHHRLLLRPIAKRDVGFIRNSQIKNELTEAEKNIVMATFNGGKVTLKDWFETINEIAPPSRPRDLNTEAGVDRLLERALRTPVLVAEAIRLRLDENETLKKQVREYEDMNLLGDARQRAGKQVSEPNAAQIKAYFDEHKDEFRQGQKLKVDQIWCEQLKAAQTVKAELDEGKDFASVKQAHSLDKEGKISDIYPGAEAYFWPELWKGDPNTVVGPVKGMYRNEFKWRVVKILEKHPGTIPEFSEKSTDRVKRTMQSKQRRAALEQYHRELLKKYTHKIYADRIKDINPLDIP
ncbi:MAG TPA: peptidyl-prolyl cis-trans isomerase [Sedimentisphaerales bacterium]|nr:peptidyl-prolyl cis-trans isomerase [Sedimentisphaerales bacterium]